MAFFFHFFLLLAASQQRKNKRHVSLQGTTTMPSPPSPPTSLSTPYKTYHPTAGMLRFESNNRGPSPNRNHFDLNRNQTTYFKPVSTRTVTLILRTRIVSNRTRTVPLQRKTVPQFEPEHRSHSEPCNHTTSKQNRFGWNRKNVTSKPEKFRPEPQPLHNNRLNSNRNDCTSNQNRFDPNRNHNNLDSRSFYFQPEACRTRINTFVTVSREPQNFEPEPFHREPESFQNHILETERRNRFDLNRNTTPTRFGSNRKRSTPNRFDPNRNHPFRTRSTPLRTGTTPLRTGS